MRSRILPGKGSKDIGLKLFTSDGSHGFCKGMTLAIFYWSGNIFSLKQEVVFERHP